MLKELGKIFGNESRVKLMRFFLANPDTKINFKNLIKRAKIRQSELKKELKNLLSIGLVNEIVLINEAEIKLKKGKTKIKQKKEKGYELNSKYVFVSSLSGLLLDFRFIDRESLLADFKRYGKIKLLCLGGVFVQDDEAKLDLLLAGDALDKEKIDLFIKKLEADYGTELRYAVFESEEFRYRVNMFDRLLKDFFKSPHEKVIEKIQTRP